MISLFIDLFGFILTYLDGHLTFRSGVIDVKKANWQLHEYILPNSQTGFTDNVLRTLCDSFNPMTITHWH